MQPLYPEIKPYARHKLAVDGLHELYIDESGTPHGIPVVFIHGGPGSGCEFNSRCFFNPAKYRIVLFDQRGAGRSKPHTSVEANTLAELVADLERIRDFLGIERWLLFGGGWGATLALAYAQRHPGAALGLVVRGVFLGRRQDIEWYCEGGASRFFPDHWEEFLKPVLQFRDQGGQADTCLAAYSALMAADNELKRMAAAKAWSVWEAHSSCMHPHPRLVKHFTDGGRALARCVIGTHYFRNDCFLEPSQLLEGAGGMADLPGIIVHGRFDCVSPLGNAYALRQAWPGAQLYIVREAGHTVTEPAMIDALIRATGEMAGRFEGEFDV